MYALGIDLGTTYTAAAVWRGGRAEICALGTHSAAVPSVVLMRADGTVLTGESAARRAVVEPDRVAREFKRRLGDQTPVVLGGTPFTAETLTARLLSAIVTAVVDREGGAPSRICVSHPANWGPFKIDLLKRAVKQADLGTVITYTTEPEAAAVSYARQERMAPGDTVAVYDLGGGTFDAAVLRRTDTGFTILGQPEGIERLGGIDIDAAVFAHVVRAVGDPLTDLDEDDPASVAAVARLRAECTEAKEALSTDTDTTIPVLLPSFSTEVRLTRAELETMIRPPLYDSIEALRRALRSAGVTPDELSAVLLVGGSSRMPIVGQLVGAELGRPVAIDTHPKHAIALGAAWLASGTALPADPSQPVGPALGSAPATASVRPGYAPPAAASYPGSPLVPASPASPVAPSSPRDGVQLLHPAGWVAGQPPYAGQQQQQHPGQLPPGMQPFTGEQPYAGQQNAGQQFAGQQQQPYAGPPPGQQYSRQQLAGQQPPAGAAGPGAPGAAEDDDESSRRRRRAAVFGGVLGAEAGAAGIIGVEAGRAVNAAEAARGGLQSVAGGPLPPAPAPAGHGVVPTSGPPQPLPPAPAHLQAHAGAPGQLGQAGMSPAGLPKPLAAPVRSAGRTLRVGQPVMVGAATGAAALLVVLAGYFALSNGDDPEATLVSPAGETSSAPVASGSVPPTVSGDGAAPAPAPDSTDPNGNGVPDAVEPPPVAPPGRLVVTVRFSGSAGRVTSTDGRINCPGTCTASYSGGSRVTLVAGGTGFVGWSACSQPDGASCTVAGSGSEAPLARYRPAAAPATTTTRRPTPTPTPTPTATPTPTTTTPPTTTSTPPTTSTSTSTTTSTSESTPTSRTSRTSRSTSTTSTSSTPPTTSTTSSAATKSSRTISSKTISSRTVLDPGPLTPQPSIG